MKTGIKFIEVLGIGDSAFDYKSAAEFNISSETYTTVLSNTKGSSRNVKNAEKCKIFIHIPRRYISFTSQKYAALYLTIPIPRSLSFGGVLDFISYGTKACHRENSPW